MNDNKQKVEETLGQAARRLLAELDARKKAVPAYSGTRIHVSTESPSGTSSTAGAPKLGAYGAPANDNGARPTHEAALAIARSPL